MIRSILCSAVARATALGVPLVLAALPAAAEIDIARGESIANSFRQNACILPEDRIGGAVVTAALAEGEYAEIVADMVARGFATGDPAVPGGVTLTPDFCGPGTEGAEPRRALVEILRYHGCSLSRADTANLLVPAGFTPDTAGPVIGAMIAAGEATPEGDLLVLSEAVCADGVD